MRFIQILIAFAIIFVPNTSSALRSHKHDSHELKAEDLGIYHNQAFDKLGELLANLAVDADDHQVFQHAVTAVASFCDSEDKECKRQSYEVTKEAFNYEDYGSQRNAVVSLPESFDENLKKSIENVYENVRLLNTNDPESVLETLNGILDDTMNVKTPNEVDKIVAIGITSVAIASTELWTSLRSTSDPRKLALLRHCEARRCLQGSSESGVIQADMDGAKEGAIDFFAEQFATFNYAGLLQVFQLMQSMLQKSIAGSIIALLGV